MDVVQFFDTFSLVVAEQVIEVPKIIVENIPSRRTAAGGPAGGSAADRDSHRPAVVLRGYGWVRLVAALWTCGGLLVAVWHLPHPVDHSTGVHRQARAG